MSHVNLAVSEAAFGKLVDKLTENISFSKTDGGDFGPFTASYSAGVRFEGGDIDLKDSPDEVVINELDVIYDPLSLTVGIDIPEICVGGFCIIPNPFGGCILRAPRICLFEGDPDASFTLDLGGLIESEISGGFNVVARYFNNPDHAGLTDHQAHEQDKANEWQFFLDPRWLDLDIIDISDTVGNILDGIIDAIVDDLLGGLPGWAKDAIRFVLGGLADLIRGILDIGDDIDEWLSDLLGVSLGLFDFILTFIADKLANENPVFSFEDPYPMLPTSGNLIPVLLPIRNVNPDITNVEFVMTADVG